jgi:hypothetical protein
LESQAKKIERAKSANKTAKKPIITAPTLKNPRLLNKSPSI